MGTYSARFPVAFHVIPLHALKGVWKHRSLLSKGQGTQPRPTTARIDEALGFTGFVHFYLAESEARLFELPILRAQLGPSERPPFPHAVLEFLLRR